MSDISYDPVFDVIFNPGSIAVYGASSKPMKSGNIYFTQLIEAGFPGKLYPINPSETEVGGLPAYRSLQKTPGPVDYVISCVPKSQALAMMEDCGKKGVKAIQLFTAGFRETGLEEDIKLEEEMAGIARKYGVRIIGPNCIGCGCPSKKIPYGMTPVLPAPGGLGFFSQSGGHAASLVIQSPIWGIGFSKIISFGNACDLNESDCLAYLANDADTKVIGSYLEGVKDGRRFFEVVREAGRIKPVVIWKGGQTSAGRHTTHSHTGSLGGDYLIWEKAMQQAGAITPSDFQEMADTLLAFLHCPKVPGKNISVITGMFGGGGGISVEAADIAARQGFTTPMPSEMARKRIASLLPKAGTIIRNPIDLGAPFNMDVLYQVVEIILDEKELDMIIILDYINMFGMLVPDERQLFDFLTKLATLGYEKKKPVVFAWSAGETIARLPTFQQNLHLRGVPVYPSLKRALRALNNVYMYYNRTLYLKERR
ncbi:MAG: CoA-binding protein [Thermodesulfobacteriota bacterium]|nr:CoA-binding protein [Thermodesulfobacteriota bacterium]